MFSTQQLLDKKTGSEGVGRYEYLQLLTQEFEKTQSIESKRQICANLSNFSYDPINFEYIKHLRIIDIFLAQLSQDDQELLHFGLAGLCNLSCDPEIKEYITHNNGINLISEQLLHPNEDISLNSLSTLIFLITSETQARITTPLIINKAIHYRNSQNPRLRNLGVVFLEDYCTTDQIALAENAGLQTIDIPLPIYQ